MRSRPAAAAGSGSGRGRGAGRIGRGVRLDRFAVRDGDRRLLTVSFAALPTPHPYALMVPQYETEAVLLDRLRALGGEVHRPFEVAAVAADDAGATLTMTGGQTLGARHVVGADGMHSIVRETSGIGFTGSAYAESFVLADVAMHWIPGPEEVSLTFGPAGLLVVAPLPGDRYRVVTTVDEAPQTPDLAFVQRMLDERAPGQARVTDIAWSSRFRVHHRLADHLRAGPFLLAGDAAHVHSPAGGQGMNTGIQDGHCLGRALATGGLDDYEARRRPVAERVVALADRMTRVATVRNPTARALRNTGLRLLGHTGFPRKLATELAELTYR